MRKRLWAALALAACLVLLLPMAQADTPPRYLTILFTHDTHDHFYPDAGDRGGYTRLATLLKEQRSTPVLADNGSSFLAPTVTLDAGDFSMGSLFQSVYATDAPELRALGAMGYDVTTLGNHEFDYRPQGLADMLYAARRSGQTLPAIVQANYRTAAAPDAQVAIQAMADYPVTDYVMLEREGLRIAVFGVMGQDSHECAPMSAMTLEPIADAAKRVVAHIQAQENADFIICLSHSGTENGKGEDYELAKAVDGIDVIVSGHTHTTLDAPIQVNHTLIVSCGPYTQNLGRLTIEKDYGAQGPQVVEYRLLPVDASVPQDAEMTALAQSFQTLVEQNYLEGYGLGYQETLSVSSQDLTRQQTGDLIGQAYIDTVRKLEGDSYVPIAFAVVPDGVIRDTIRAGAVTTAHAFDILSLGSGADGSPGYPLVSVYLTGKDLKNTFEVDASISALMPAAELFGGGCWWQYNPHRMFLDRVTDCRVNGEALDNDRLYRVVADLYSGQMLSAVKAKSFGLLSITPRDADGNAIVQLEDHILHDGAGQEVKAWYALAGYLKDQGVNEAPVSKTADDSWHPVRLLFPMGAPTALVLLLALFVIALFSFALRRRRRRRKTSYGYRPYRG